MRALAMTIALLPWPVLADSMVAARTVRAQAVLSPEDVSVVPDDIPGALSLPEDAVGQEAKVTLYAGRPIRAEDVGPPAVVKRNQMVPLAYRVGGLSILTDGRALERGAVGEIIHVMNLASHTTIQGEIGADGTVMVGPSSKD